MGVAVKEAAWFIAQLESGDASRASDRDIATIAPLLASRRLSAGQVIFKAGGVPDGIWAIRRGLVELSVGAGRSRRIVDIAKPGQLVGLPYASLHRPADVTARALTTGDSLFLQEFDRLLQDSPQFARLSLRKVSSHIVETRARILELLGRTLPERLARLLITECEDGRLPVSQAHIAQMLGVQRSSVNRILRSLEEDRLVRLGYSRVEILEPERLERIAGSDGRTSSV